MTLYPEPNISTVLGLFEHVNTITSGYVVTLIIAGSFIINMMILNAFFIKFSTSVAASSLFALITSLILFTVGLVQAPTIVVLVVMTIGSFVWSFMDN